MENIGMTVIVLAALAALALVIYLVKRNRDDRKKLFPPEATDDPVEQKRADQQRDQDQL